MKPNLKATTSVRWIWHFVGVAEVSSKLMSPLMIECAFDVPWWRRMLTRVFLGSVWERPSMDYLIARKQAQDAQERGMPPPAVNLSPNEGEITGP